MMAGFPDNDAWECSHGQCKHNPLDLQGGAIRLQIPREKIVEYKRTRYMSSSRYCEMERHLWKHELHNYKLIWPVLRNFPVLRN